MSVPTINDVAKAAGVSKRTVSRVINNAPGTKEETRRRVLKVIEELQYSPNVLAQRLARGETGIMGVFAYEQAFPLERESFYYPFLEGIELQARDLGYDLLLFTQGIGGEQRSLYDGNRNRTHLADGLILMGGQSSKQDLRRLCEDQVPFVCIGKRTIPGLVIRCVDPEYQAIYADVTRKLIKLGHRHIGFIGGTDNEPDQDKLAGYRRAVDVANLPRIECLDSDTHNVKGMVDFLRRPDRPSTALIVNYSHVITELCTELTRRSLSIPADISLVAFDAIGAQYGSLPLAHIQMKKQDMAKQAVTLLRDTLKGETEQIVAKVPCHFVDGESIAPPR